MAQTTRETRRLGSFLPVLPSWILNNVGSTWKKHQYVVSTVKKQIKQKKKLTYGPNDTRDASFGLFFTSTTLPSS